MAREVELKFIGADYAALRERLQAEGAQSAGRHLERNAVYDTGEGTLRSARMLLRLRRRIWADRTQALLTLKCPPAGAVPAGVKVWDEEETAVADGEAMHAILTGLGYRPAFRYDKEREDWSLRGVHVSLDRLVFGEVVEIEGPQDDIRAVAALLGMTDCETSTATYHDMNRAWRKASGVPPCDDFMFDDEEVGRILDGLRHPA